MHRLKKLTITDLPLQQDAPFPSNPPSLLEDGTSPRDRRSMGASACAEYRMLSAIVNGTRAPGAMHHDVCSRST